MINKKMMFIFVLICITIFFIFYYIFFVSGNNINRNQNEFVENILNNLDEYEANIDVIVTSNKNENYYSMTQIVSKDNKKMIINGPENIKGMIIENSNNELKITNTKINAEKIYYDYNAIMNNSLYLDSFIKDYKNNVVKIREENEQIILEVNINNNQNTYIKYKELYLDKSKKKPKKLIIKDVGQNENISIIYNDIKIK